MIFTTTGLLMGVVAALLARRLIHTPEPPSDESRWLEPYEIHTSLDLGGHRLSAPNGRPGIRSCYGGTDLYAFRDGQYRGITEATELARYVHKVRGQADGDEFWRLVREFDLDLPVSRPPRKSVPEAESKPEPVAAVPWWWDYDSGIEGRARPLSDTNPWEQHSLVTAASHRTSLDADPEFLGSGPGFVVYSLACIDQLRCRLSCETTLEPGRLALSSKVEVRDR
jgi:hypothetical protein